MGIHDRDYYRDESKGWWDRFGTTPVTKWLILTNIIVYLFQLIGRNPETGTDPVTEYGCYQLAAILNGEIWRLLTSHFLHSPVSLWHIVLNMYLLFWAGREIESIYGSREFFRFYLLTALLVSVGKVGIDILAHSNPLVRAIGASGPVTAVFILFACHYPYRQVLVFFILPAPIYLVAIFVVLMDLLGVMGMGQPGIGHLAHLLGALFGYCYFRYHWRIGRWIPTWKANARPHRRSQPRLFIDEADEPVPNARSVSPTSESTSGPLTTEQLEARLDEVLEKVAQFGKGSLTSEEQSILMRASEIYQRRRS